MNKQHIEKLRKSSREASEPVRWVVGAIDFVNLCNRKINRNRRAVFKFNLFRRSDGKKFTALVPSTLRERAIAELKNGGLISAKLQIMSPRYKRDSNEYELTDFSSCAN